MAVAAIYMTNFMAAFYMYMPMILLLSGLQSTSDVCTAACKEFRMTSNSNKSFIVFGDYHKRDTDPVWLDSDAVNWLESVKYLGVDTVGGRRLSFKKQVFRRHTAMYGWLGSRVVSVLNSGAVGPGFKSQSRRCRVTVLGKLFTSIMPLFTKQQNW